MDGLHGLTPDEWLTRWRRAMNTVEDREVLRALREDFESNTRPHLAPGQVEEVLDSHSAAIARMGGQA